MKFNHNQQIEETNQDSEIEQLILEQERLHSDAQSIIDNLCLFGLGERVGLTRLVGSVLLRTVVKPDIDFQVLIQGASPIFAASLITEALFRQQICSKTAIYDYPRKSAVKLDFQYDYKQTLWNIDYWLTTDERALADNERLKYSMTEQQRRTIIQLKHRLLTWPLGAGATSYYLYRAVIERGVKTIREYEKYLLDCNLDYLLPEMQEIENKTPDFTDSATD